MKISVFLLHSEADLGLLQHPRGSLKPLTIITKSSTMDDAAVLDPPLALLVLARIISLLCF